MHAKITTPPSHSSFGLLEGMLPSVLTRRVLSFIDRYHMVDAFVDCIAVRSAEDVSRTLSNLGMTAQVAASQRAFIWTEYIERSITRAEGYI
jgi:hypothetical protein